MVEAILLAQQATLETRDAKHEPRTLTEQRAAWQEQAEDVLGGPAGVSFMVGHRPVRPTAAVTDRDGGCGVGAGHRHSGPRRDPVPPLHLAGLARPRRSAPAGPGRQPARRARRRGRRPGHRPHPGRSLGPSDPDRGRHRGAAGAAPRRRRPACTRSPGLPIFTSTQILAAEQRLVGTAGKTDRHSASPDAVDLALLEQAANGTTLNPGQAALVTQMATSGARLQLAIAPAGAGKTTAMRALTAAWVEDGGTVIGLAPSAAAAAVLREQTGATTDTLAKLTWSISHDDLPGWAEAIGPHTLVIDRRGRDGRHPHPGHRRRTSSPPAADRSA